MYKVYEIDNIPPVKTNVEEETFVSYDKVSQPADKKITATATTTPPGAGRNGQRESLTPRQTRTLNAATSEYNRRSSQNKTNSGSMYRVCEIGNRPPRFKTSVEEETCVSDDTVFHPAHKKKIVRTSNTQHREVSVGNNKPSTFMIHKEPTAIKVRAWFSPHDNHDRRQRCLFDRWSCPPLFHNAARR